MTAVHLLGSVGSACMALLVMRLRLRAGQKPTSAKRILLPALGMATGFLMFLLPVMQVPWGQAATAFAAGMLCSVPLIRTSKFEVREGDIYLQRSKAFAGVLIALLALRIGLHQWVERYVSVEQSGALLFILAFGMLLTWRLMMWRGFRRMAGRG